LVLPQQPLHQTKEQNIYSILYKKKKKEILDELVRKEFKSGLENSVSSNIFKRKEMKYLCTNVIL